MPQNIEPNLSTLLHVYKVVFQKLEGLLPIRENDIVILMKESKPFKVRPYRYHHSQKEQTQNMVNEMLHWGIIQPNISPFSLPIILVKKKYGNQRFCIDYRALNSIMVKDNFLIPIVDELLNELYGTNFFSKLDLYSGYHQILAKEIDIRKPFKLIMAIENGWLSHPGSPMLQ